MMGLWGYANQLIAVIAVIAVLEEAVEEPLGERTKTEMFGSAEEKGCSRVIGQAPSSCQLVKLGLFCSPKPTHTKSSLALFQNYPSVASSGLCCCC